MLQKGFANALQSSNIALWHLMRVVSDLSDTAHLVIFVRGIDTNFNITEELCSLNARKGTTTGEDLNFELNSDFQFYWEKKKW